MKLIYLTNVQIPAEDAQSIQVKEMSRAFSNKLGDNFLLISPLNEKNRGLEADFNWKKIKTLIKKRNLRFMELILKALPIAIKEKPEIIFSRDIGIVFFFKLIGFKTSYEIHKPFETKIGKLIFKIIGKKIKIISISQNLKDYLIGKYNIKEGNISAVHDGVDLNKFQIEESKDELREKLGFDRKEFIVLYSGSLQKGKGVQIVAELAGKLNDVSFIIVGGDKKERELLRKEWPDNMKFIGRKKHELIPQYLKLADLLILPLTKELGYWKYSSPLKLFEYMASGVPILASNLGAIKEVLNEGNSFLFNPGKTEEAALKIRKIKNNQLEAVKRSKRALIDVKNHSWLKRVEKIILCAE